MAPDATPSARIAARSVTSPLGGGRARGTTVGRVSSPVTGCCHRGAYGSPASAVALVVLRGPPRLIAPRSERAVRSLAGEDPVGGGRVGERVEPDEPALRVVGHDVAALVVLAAEAHRREDNDLVV